MCRFGSFLDPRLSVGRGIQLPPRTGDQRSMRTLGLNFCRRNQAPDWLVPTWKATRSPNTLIGNSRSSKDGELRGNGCWVCGALSEFTNVVSAKFPAPSTYIVR